MRNVIKTKTALGWRKARLIRPKMNPAAYAAKRFLLLAFSIAEMNSDPTSMHVQKEAPLGNKGQTS